MYFYSDALQFSNKKKAIDNFLLDFHWRSSVFRVHLLTFVLACFPVRLVTTFDTFCPSLQ